MDITNYLNTIFEIGKVAAIPVALFFIIRFVNGVDTLKKRMDNLLISLGANNATCEQRHKDIDKTIDDHTEQISELYDTTKKQGEDIAKVKGFLKMED